MLSLFRQIIQHSPQLEVLNMWRFSYEKNDNENMGEIVLETLLSSSIESITTLNLSSNYNWFSIQRISNVELLAELINK